MSRRGRIWKVARAAKHALAFAGPEDDDEGGIDAGPLWSCPGCCKARAEPFHCTPCNADAEGPGHDD